MPAGQALRLPRWCLLMCCSELVQLLEAVAVDDLFQLAVVVVVQGGLETSDFHQFAILLGVRFPSNEEGSTVGVGVAVVSEFRPDAAHRVCPVFVCFERVG